MSISPPHKYICFILSTHDTLV